MDLAQWIRPGDGVVFGQACAEPQTLVEALVAQREAYSGATLFLGVNWSGTVKPEHADHLRLTAYCGSGHNRKLADAGVLDIHPLPYSQLATLFRQRKIRADIVLLQVSPPNARGEYSLGLSAEYLVPALEAARAVIGEVNDRVPWTYSDRLLKKSDFAALIETSREPVTAPFGAPGPQEAAIARSALPFILLAGLCFSSLDATAKYLVRDHALLLVVWARYVGQMIIVTPISWHRGGNGFWRTKHLKMQLLRSLCLVSATLSFFGALRYVPLAEAPFET